MTRVPGRRTPLEPRGKCLPKFASATHQPPRPLGREWPWVPPAPGSRPPPHPYSQGGGARPGLSIIHEVSRAFVTTWVDFRAESSGAGSGGDGGERPGRAGPGEPGSWGATPAGCGSRVFPAAGHLALRPCRVQTGFRGGGDKMGVRSAMLPKRRGRFPACPAPQRRELGRGRIGPFPSAPAELRSEDGFTPSPPSMCFYCHLRGGLIIITHRWSI